MRLCRFEIHNFKGIESASFDWEDIVVLIGENNVGKSTVLQALHCFLLGAAIKDRDLFLNKLTDQDHAVVLVGHFDELSAFEGQSVATRGRTVNGK